MACSASHWPQRINFAINNQYPKKKKKTSDVFIDVAQQKHSNK